MTGMELLEGLSFVDERFIAEAETAKLGRNVPWMKVLSVAACLCILIVGAFALENFGHKGAMEGIKEEAAAPAAPQAAPEAAPEAAPLAPEEEACVESAEEQPLTDELHNIPYATLRIISVEDDHWVAVVEELPDEPVVLEAGMEVTVIIDTSKIPETDKDGDGMYGGIPLPEEGMLAKIEDGAYDASANTLYVTGATLEEPPA